jgi:hypothetical protein
MNESLKTYPAQYVYLYVIVPVADIISLVTLNHWWRDWVHGKIGSSARTPRGLLHTGVIDIIIFKLHDKILITHDKILMTIPFSFGGLGIGISEMIKK